MIIPWREIEREIMFVGLVYDAKQASKWRLWREREKEEGR